MDRLRLALLIAIASTPTRPGFAASPAVMSEALQQQALSCAGEAAQFCPDIWLSEDHGLSCMTGKRALFSPRCRVIYDEVAHVLKR